MSCKLLVIANQKGGTSKTISCYNLGAALMRYYGKTVLMIDMDAQCSLTVSCGIIPDPDDEKYQMSTKKLFENVDPLECCFTIDALDDVDTKTGETIHQSLYLVSATQELALKTLSVPKNETKNFKRNIETLRDYFDYILIDCSPSLDMLVLHALSVADKVLIPVLPEKLDMEGLKLIMGTIAAVKDGEGYSNPDICNKDLEIAGLIAAKYRSRVNMHKEYVAKMAAQYNLLGIVPEAAVVTKELERGLPVVLAHKNTVAAKEYINIAKKIVEME